MPKKLSELSGYTSAGNCTDIQDCQDGIKEILQFMEYKRKKGNKIPNTAYIKYYKLRQKLEKLLKK